jgi:methionine-gamma-lyase
MTHPMRLQTLAVHGGEEPQRHLGALSTPLYHASVYAFPSAAEGAEIHEGRRPGYFYGRIGNPTQAAAEAAVASLEGGEAALLTSSGMAALSATLLSLVRAGDHVVATSSLYATTRLLLERLLGQLGIATTYVEPEDAPGFAAAVRPTTRAFVLESPTNPTLRLIDLAAVCALAKAAGAVSVVDNTFATPFNQQPLALGADIVVHSATKYLGGHGDLLAGAVVGRTEAIERMRWDTQKILGGVIAPETAWLLHRGIKTLALRMERHNSNALAIARFLAKHPLVQRVHYPGLRSHPQHALARRQMTGYGGVIAFDVGSQERGRRTIDALRLCARAVSLGDVATLVQHSATMTHASVPPEQRLAAGVTDGLLRISVGIEAVEDLLADLDGALGVCPQGGTQ